MSLCKICGIRQAERTGTKYKGKTYFARKCYQCRKEYPGRRTIEERFWEKVKKSDVCWEWTASKSKCGYGRIGIATGKFIEAHRFSWSLHNGCEVPDGKQINHHCDNPSCVRPDHLYCGTHKDNMGDMKKRGRSRNRFTVNSPHRD